MKNTILAVGLVLAMAQIAIADVAISWVNFGQDQKPVFVNGYCHQSGWEAWSFGQPGFPILEAGKLEVIRSSKNGLTLAGGYLSHWTKTNQTYLEPFVLSFGKLSDKWSYKIKYGAYLPLDGGPFAHFSEESRVTRKLDRKGQVQIGIAGRFYDEEGMGFTAKAGVVGLFQIDDNWSLATRYFPVGAGPDEGKVEICRTF